MLVVAILAPAPATASRTLPRATSPGLERLPALEVVDADDHAEPLPLYTFVDVVALDRVAGLGDDQVEAAVGRQRHRLHLVSSELARPDEPVWGSKTATGVSTWLNADKHLEGSDLRRKLHRPSFQGLWTDPVSGLGYARNRWYDARSASWLSEDPMGAVDSPNLYAFVGWGPHGATDPLGLAVPIGRGQQVAAAAQSIREQQEAVGYHLDAARSAVGSLEFELSWDVLRHNVGDTNYRRDVLTNIASVPYHVGLAGLNAAGWRLSKSAVDIVPGPAVIFSEARLAALGVSKGASLVDEAAGLVDEAAALSKNALVLADEGAALTDDLARAASRAESQPPIPGTSSTRGNLAATRTAVDAADDALAAGKARGAASQLVVDEHVFTDVSGAKPDLHPRVQEALDAVPPAARAPWHGKCAEVGCVDQAFKAGLDPQGGTSIAVNIGKSGSGHGTFKEACSSCRRMLEFLGVRF